MQLFIVVLMHGIRTRWMWHKDLNILRARKSNVKFCVGNTLTLGLFASFVCFLHAAAYIFAFVGRSLGRSSTFSASLRLPWLPLRGKLLEHFRSTRSTTRLLRWVRESELILAPRSWVYACTFSDWLQSIYTYASTLALGVIGSAGASGKSKFQFGCAAICEITFLSNSLHRAHYSPRLLNRRRSPALAFLSVSRPALTRSPLHSICCYKFPIHVSQDSGKRIGVAVYNFAGALSRESRARCIARGMQWEKNALHLT